MEKINVAELLRNCPKDMELDCTMFDNVTFARVDYSRKQFPIEIVVGGRHSKYLTKEGCYHDNTLLPEAKCIIFPKGKTTWEGFQRPFKDGDIIYTNNFIAIFSHIAESGTVWYHCYYCISTKNFNAKHSCGIGNINYDEFRLATEEEKEKLFKVIKYNGYKWNPKTKSLEKLPKFKVGNKVRHKSNHNIVFTITSIEEDSYVCGAKPAFWFADQDNYELVPNKFDITTLKPFDKVLVRDSDEKYWSINLFGFYNEITKQYCCMGNTDIGWDECIPYEGNEHLLGTTNDCDEFYKIW